MLEKILLLPTLVGFGQTDENKNNLRAAYFYLLKYLYFNEKYFVAGSIDRKAIEEQINSYFDNLSRLVTGDDESKYLSEKRAIMLNLESTDLDKRSNITIAFDSYNYATLNICFQEALKY
jgi:hypothetical protein